jgi:hypothetical protein
MTPLRFANAMILPFALPKSSETPEIVKQAVM